MRLTYVVPHFLGCVFESEMTSSERLLMFKLVRVNKQSYYEAHKYCNDMDEILTLPLNMAVGGMYSIQIVDFINNSYWSIIQWICFPRLKIGHVQHSLPIV